MIADRVIFACIIVVAAVYFYATAQIPSLDIGDPLGPKAFPRLLGVCLLGTAVLLLVEMIKEAAQRRRQAAAPASETADPESRRHFVIIAAVVAWTAVYYAVFDALGYLIATAIYLFVLMIGFHRGKWMANILTSLLFTLGSYVLFVKVLTVSLAKGMLYF